jgi:hypothetical protein
MFELKMKTDVTHFEAELRHFAKTYLAEQIERGLLGIDIGEWQQGFWDTRATNETHTPVERNEGRGWSITLRRQSEQKEWIDVPDIPFNLWVSQIGGEYPLLLKISPFEKNVGRFVKAYMARCKELWDAIPLRTTLNQAEEGQTGTKLGKESDRKRIFGLRVEYLIAAIILAIFIIVSSLLLVPDWARSNLGLVMLFAGAFATAISLIANFRKAFE